MRPRSRIRTLCIPEFALLLVPARLIEAHDGRAALAVPAQLPYGDIALWVALGAASLLAAWLALQVVRRDRRLRRAQIDLEKRVEERTADLQRSEALLRSIIDNSTAVIHVKDVDGRYLLVNRHYEDLSGLTQERIRGKSDRDFFPPATADAFRADDLRVLEADGPIEIEDVVPLPTGSRAFITLKFPLHDAAGKPYATCGISTDITERKQTEEIVLNIARGVAAQTGEVFFNAVVEHLAKALDAEYAFVGEVADESATRVRSTTMYADGRFAEEFEYDLAGTPCEHVVGKSIRAYPMDVQSQFPDDAILQELGVEAYVGAPLFDSSGKALGLIAVLFRRPLDDTGLCESLLQIFAARAAAELERTRSEEERDRLHEQLLQAQKMEAVGTLAAGIAHDFNNVVTAILGFADVVAAELPEGSRAADAVEGIRKASTQASGITRALMTFSRKARAEKSPHRLEVILDDSLKVLRRVLPASIEIGVELPEKELWVEADPTQIQQVLINLAVNARDAMPKGGQLRIALERASGRNAFDPPGLPDRGAGAAILTVEDTGPGIPEEIQERIFDPFFTTKSRGEGVGLGMAIVHGIVMDHGGRIAVDSSEGRGTRIAVSLPLVEDSSAHPVGTGGLRLAAGNGETVLVAEDNRQVRAILASALSAAGYDVIQAEDGALAIAAFERRRFEVSAAVLDADLPKKSGYTCLSEIHQARPGLPAIVISGAPGIEEAEEDRENVFFLAKPFEVAELVTLLGTVLSRARKAE